MATAPDSIGFVYEQGLLRIVAVARSTRQNWARVGIAPDPPNGVFRERHVVETVVVTALVRALRSVREVRQLWRAHRQEVLAALGDPSADKIVGLLEPRLLRLELVGSTAHLGSSMRSYEPTVLLPLGAEIAEARGAFWRLAHVGAPQRDARRRASSASPSSGSGEP